MFPVWHQLYVIYLLCACIIGLSAHLSSIHIPPLVICICHNTCDCAFIYICSHYCNNWTQMLSTVLLSHTPVLLSCSHYMPCSLDVIKVLYYQPSQAQRYECIMGVSGGCCVGKHCHDWWSRYIHWKAPIKKQREKKKGVKLLNYLHNFDYMWMWLCNLQRIHPIIKRWSGLNYPMSELATHYVMALGLDAPWVKSIATRRL